jgi:hypothetical protein
MEKLQRLCRELCRIASHGADWECLAVQPTLLAVVVKDSTVQDPYEQAELIHQFLLTAIERWDRTIRFKGELVAPELCREAWVANLGLKEPQLRAHTRYVQTVQRLRLPYPASTWRRTQYQGEFLKILAHHILSLEG